MGPERLGQRPHESGCVTCFSKAHPLTDKIVFCTKDWWNTAENTEVQTNMLTDLHRTGQNYFSKKRQFIHKDHWHKGKTPKWNPFHTHYKNQTTSTTQNRRTGDWDTRISSTHKFKSNIRVFSLSLPPSPSSLSFSFSLSQDMGCSFKKPT